LKIHVLLVVLLGALLHASWNLLVKARPNKHAATAIVYICAGVLAAAALPFAPLPSAASWPYLAASTITEFLYGVVLAATYRSADLSHAYPLMRGTAPLLVALGSSVLVGERLSEPLWVGVILMSAALLSLIFDAHGRNSSTASSVLAILNAFLIAAYTMIDGVGGRLSGHAVSYSLWLFMLTAVPWMGWLAVRRRKYRWEEIRGEVPAGVLGGACSLASYTVAVWAMTQAPIAVVAAVRESSILFGTLLGAIVLKERVTKVRALAVVGIAIGVWIIRSN
jgi:drug/metabolite transporter (DMT)-like permease